LVDVKKALDEGEKWVDKPHLIDIYLQIEEDSRKIAWSTSKKCIEEEEVRLGLLVKKWYDLIVPPIAVTFNTADRKTTKGKFGFGMDKDFKAFIENSIQALFATYENERAKPILQALQVPVSQLGALRKQLPLEHVVSAYLFTQLNLEYDRQGQLGLRFFFFNKDYHLFAPNETGCDRMVTRLAQKDVGTDVNEDRLLAMVVYKVGAEFRYGEVQWGDSQSDEV